MGSSINTETYYPKALARFSSKFVSALTLKSISMDASLKLLSSSGFGSGAPGIRDARGKKSLRRIIDETLPRELQTDVLNKGVEKWFGSERMLNLMDIFEPKRAILDNLDLIGSFRYAYGCYYCTGKLFWSNGTIERLNLNLDQCNRLHQIIVCSDALKKHLLRTIVISTERNALRASNLPNIFARSPHLTCVTLLNGATNHILRILGKNCAHLRILDVSHSNSVTDAGLGCLLLRACHAKRNPFANLTPGLASRLGPEEKNACAGSLCKIILIGTDVSHGAFNLACHLLGTSYYLAFLPDLMILRPHHGRTRGLPGGASGNAKTVQISARIENGDSLHPIFGGDDVIRRKVNEIMTRFAERRRGTEATFQVLDHHPGMIPGNKGYAQNYLRSVDSYITEAMIGTQIWKEKFHITELILAWDSFTWSVTSLPDLTELGVSLPNLVVLKARIQGIWERREKLFPSLRDTYVWTVSDATVLSFLRFCPRIQTLKFNCLDLLHSNIILNDANFTRALNGNQSLLRNLTEVCIRPASHLHAGSARFLLEKAPKLRRLGDMESWRVSPEDIKNLNDELDKANSKCVLTVLSFPPKEKHQYLL